MLTKSISFFNSQFMSQLRNQNFFFRETFLTIQAFMFKVKPSGLQNSLLVTRLKWAQVPLSNTRKNSR